MSTAVARAPIALTPEKIESQIAAEYFTTGDRAFAGAPSHPRMACITICALVLKNGFVVTGESSCIDNASFDPEVGMRVARANAIAKVWPLEGYALRTVITAFEDR